MKDIIDYIGESGNEFKDFTDAVRDLNPGVPADVKRYFAIMYDNDLIMHPDDSWEDCTARLSHAQCELLDEFVSKALDVHGDDVYDWGFEALQKYYEKH